MLDVTRRRLLAAAARAQADGRLPSLVAGVVHDGELAWEAARGPANAAEGGEPATSDTQYRIGSITKTFTAVQVMQLRDAGRLELDTTVETLVPGTSVGDRTIGQLLGHVSGLRAETAGDWWERSPGRTWDQLMEPLDASDVLHPAGRRFHYSNVGYAILGQVVARLHGASWADRLRADVLEPLGLHRTTQHAEPPAATGLAVHPWADSVLREPSPDYDSMAPAGQLWSTVGDLAVWARFLLGDTGDVLDAGTLEEMSQPGALDVLGPSSTGYGLGLQVLHVDGRRLVGHGGSVPGFLAVLFVDGEERTGAVALANGTSGMSAELGTQLLAAVRELEPRVVEPWDPQALPEGVRLDVLGTWYWGPYPLVLRAEDEQTLVLETHAGRGRESRFRRFDGRWVGLDGYYAGETLTFGRDGSSDGAVTHLDIGSFLLTRAPYDPPVDAKMSSTKEDGWQSAPGRRSMPSDRRWPTTWRT